MLQTFPDDKRDAWSRKALWTVKETVFLLCGYLPDKSISPEDFPELAETHENIRRAIRARELHCNGRAEMRPADVIAWATDHYPLFPFANPKGAAQAPEGTQRAGKSDPEPLHVSQLTLLSAEFDAVRDESGEFYCVKHLVEAVATYTPRSFQDVAAWLAAELQSASEHERPTWFQVERDEHDEESEIPLSPQEGMQYLLELASSGPQHPRRVMEIGFHLSAIRPFVMRRLATENGSRERAQETEADAKERYLRDENNRLDRELAHLLLEANNKKRHYLISTVCAAILKRDDPVCKPFQPWIGNYDERIFGDMARMALHKIEGKTACDPSAEYWRLTDWAMDHARNPPDPFFELFDIRSTSDLIRIVIRELEGERFFGATIWDVMEHVYHGVPVYRARPDGTHEELEPDAPDMQAMRYLGRSGMCSNAGLSMFPDIMRPEYYFKASDLGAYRLFFRGETPSDEESLSVIRNSYRQHIGARDYNRQRAVMDDNTVAVASGESAQPSRWPWGEYTTPALELLAEIVQGYCVTGRFQGKPSALTDELERAGLGPKDDVKRLTAAFDPESRMNERAAAARKKSSGA